jgi:hypothetical protein
VDVAAAPDHVLRPAELEQAGSGFVIGAADGLGDARDWDAVGAQAIRVDIHLILLGESAYRRDF